MRYARADYTTYFIYAKRLKTYKRTAMKQLWNGGKKKDHAQ